MIVTQHAITRWREYTGSKQPEDKIATKVEQLVQQAKQIQLKGKYTVYQLIAHKGKDATYVKHYDTNFVFVIVNDKVVTLYPHKSDQFVEV